MYGLIQQDNQMYGLIQQDNQMYGLIQQDNQMYVQHNTEARSCNHCYCGKAINTEHPER